MDDDFDLKPRLRKLAVYAAGVVALVIVIVVVLTVISHSGKTTTALANGTTTTTTSTSSSKHVNSKWEYASVLARCSMDRQTGKMICNQLPKGDSTDVTGVVSRMSDQGWELVGVSNGNDKGGAVSAFMFKRAK